MKAIIFTMLSFLLISCNSVDAETKKEIRETLRAFTDNLSSGNLEGVSQHCTSNGFASISKHFPLASKTDLKEFGAFLEEKKISRFERIDNTENVKVSIGDYQSVTGYSAIVFMKVEGAWKIERYLAGK